MTREKSLLRIHDEFGVCADEFCAKSGGIYIEKTSEYKGEENAENLKALSAKISYNSFIIEFKYTAKSFLSVVSSILECYVYLGKGELEAAIPLPMLLDYCDVDEPTPLCIPMIASPEAMREAFEHIGETLVASLAVLTAVCDDGQRKNAVFSAFCSEANFQFGLGLDEPIAVDGENGILPYLNEGLYSFFTLRLCASHFINAINGEHSIALKQLKKVKKPLGYEKRVLKLWKQGASVKELPHVQKYVKTLNKSGAPNASIKEFVAFFTSWIILTAAFSVVYLGLYFLLLEIEGRESVLIVGALSNIPYCILFAFLSAIATSYFARFLFYRVMFPKQYETYRAADYVQNRKSDDKLMRGLLIVITVAAIVGSVFLSKWNVNFKQNGFVDNSELLSLKGTYYSYDEIDRVYYKPDRVNGFGKTIPYGSWVLKMRDGREIDLYELDAEEDYEDKLIPLLEDKGILVDSGERNE